MTIGGQQKLLLILNHRFALWFVLATWSLIPTNVAAKCLKALASRNPESVLSRARKDMIPIAGAHVCLSSV